MKFKYVSDTDFSEVISAQTSLVLVVFVTDWSGICYIVESFLVSLAKRFQSEVLILKTDFEKNEKTVMGYAIQEVPTVLFFREGELIDRIEGVFSKNEIDARVQKHF